MSMTTTHQTDAPSGDVRSFGTRGEADAAGGAGASPPEATRSIEPEAAWAAVRSGEARLLDLRTAAERRRYGAPPGATPVPPC
jgi:hypothetical protein